MDLLARKFTAQSVALASGTTAKNISNWTDHALIMGQREPLGKGNRREFSWFNVMEVALANALMEIGVRSPGDAFRAAQRFSHSGDGGIEWVGDDGFTDNDPHRYPGLPYHHDLGVTFLCVSGPSSCVVLDQGGKLAVNDITRQLGDPAGFIALDVSRVFSGVTHRMALDGREVLDQVYEESAS